MKILIRYISTRRLKQLSRRGEDSEERKKEDPHTFFPSRREGCGAK
jgi:hypothetical protein